ncbi:MAG: thiamine diphosphokinase [Lachnospiraceae bacterium]|nr:thiamine diphosphokinase [Lachnospiraceae bacterium]
MRAILICGGLLSEGFLNQTIKMYPDAVVYAVDGGLAVADKAGIMPTYLVGDFDTADASLVEQYEAKCVTLRHHPEKDATDTELAIEDALERGAEELYLLGATGSRLDHTFANVHMLYKVLLRGKKAWIVNENNRISLHREPFCKKKEELFGTYVSFLPFFGEVTGIKLSGVKYPLNGATMTAGNSLGVSNECVENSIEVSFTDGYLLMIEARD